MLTRLYCGDHFTMYRNVELFCCKYETNTMYVNCTSIKNVKIPLFIIKRHTNNE